MPSLGGGGRYGGNDPSGGASRSNGGYGMGGGGNGGNGGVLLRNQSKRAQGNTDREKAAREKAAKEQAAKEKAAREKAAQEAAAREQRQAEERQQAQRAAAEAKHGEDDKGFDLQAGLRELADPKNKWAPGHEAMKAGNEHGDWTRNEEGQWEFEPDRGLLGSLRDSVFGYDRNVSMKAMVDQARRSPKHAQTFAEAHAEGNMMTENGKSAVDKVGVAIDVARPFGSLLTGNFAGAAYGAVNAFDTFRDMAMLDGESSKSKQQVASSQVAKGRAASRGEADSFDGAFGRLLRPRAGGGGGSGKADEAATGAGKVRGATRKRPKRGKGSLILTGRRGLEDGPVLLGGRYAS